MAEQRVIPIPDGSFTLSKRPAAFPTGAWAQVVSGHGPFVKTADGDVLLDTICALGALTVGHAHPRIVEAVERQVRDGAIYSLPHVLETKVAERLTALIPCAHDGQIKVVKTGSEACAGAIRIARSVHANRRPIVLAMKGHYHGWHDWWAAAADLHPGVPKFMERAVKACDSVDMLMAELEPEGWPYAAVIVEPERIEQDSSGGLAELRAVTQRVGTVLIFDETLSGGRLRVAGAQELYRVTPDLAIYGKAFGGGLPLAFIAGPTHLMQHAWPISGTFSSDTISLAACDAMLDLYADGEIIHKLWENGQRLMRAFRLTADRYPHLGLKVHGLPPRFWIRFAPSVDRRAAMSVFVQQCWKRHVLAHQAVVFASAAMAPFEADLAASIFVAALDVVGASANLSAAVEGQPYQDSVR